MIAGYVRLSKDDDRKNYVSIENQKLIISQYAAGHHLCVDRWYEDDGVSGYIFNRPGFCRMMEDMDKDIDIILVKDFSRLGRHNARVLLLLDEFKEREKQLIVIEDNYDSKKTEDDTIGIKTWYNERYVKDTSKKIKRALNARQKEGTLLTPPPFGYQRSEYGQGGIDIVPEEAECITFIFELYKKGWGYRRIAAYLTGQQIKTPSMARRYKGISEGRQTKRQAAAEWSDGMVRDVLNNDYYTGTLRLHKRARVTVHGKDKRVPEKDQYVFPCHHCAIIDQSLFQEVQNARVKRAETHLREQADAWADTSIPNPFCSCLFCKDCKSRLTPILRSSSGNKRKYYICSTYNTKGKSFCSAAHLIEEKALMGDIMNYLCFCRNAMKDAISNYKIPESASAKKSSGEAPAKLRQLMEEQEHRLKILFAQKIKDMAACPDHADFIGQSYDALQEEIIHKIQYYHQQLYHPVPAEPEAAKGKCTNAPDIIDALLHRGYLERDDIDAFVERIEVDKNGFPEIQLKYVFPPETGLRPADELNRRELDVFRWVLELIREDSRGFTSVKYLAAKLSEAGYAASKKLALIYIEIMTEMGILTKTDNALKPYVIHSNTAKCADCMKFFHYLQDI